jgi:hypothetical protein
MRGNLFWLSDEQWNGLNLTCRRMFEAWSGPMIAVSLAASGTC